MGGGGGSRFLQPHDIVRTPSRHKWDSFVPETQLAKKGVLAALCTNNNVGIQYLDPTTKRTAASCYHCLHRPLACLDCCPLAASTADLFATALIASHPFHWSVALHTVANLLEHAHPCFRHLSERVHLVRSNRRFVDSFRTHPQWMHQNLRLVTHARTYNAAMAIMYFFLLPGAPSPQYPSAVYKNLCGFLR